VVSTAPKEVKEKVNDGSQIVEELEVHGDIP
jgi:hypothetical protein